MADEQTKWRSPNGHPIASHETDRMIETPAPTEKVDVDKLRYEVVKKCKLVAYEIDGANKAIDYLTNTGRLR